MLLFHDHCFILIVGYPVGACLRCEARSEQVFAVHPDGQFGNPEVAFPLCRAAVELLCGWVTIRSCCSESRPRQHYPDGGNTADALWTSLGKARQHAIARDQAATLFGGRFCNKGVMPERTKCAGKRRNFLAELAGSSDQIDGSIAA